jgi:two-component system response regulator HydG
MADSAERRAGTGGPQLARLRLAQARDETFPEIDGTSAVIEALKQHMRRVARDPFVTVLLQGQTGTGKERVAAAIHRASPRHRSPFVVVNCAGLSPTLIEDELFGHVRGAFTGATSDRSGPFERAAGGTVFLDEIGELTPDLQARLLRALQERTVQRLGSGRETAFDVRVIAATHVDLASAVARGSFREDLYYRLKVYPVHVPSLHQRGPADLQVLVAAILARLTARRQRPSASLDDPLLDLFTRYEWPGNVRELENVLEHMVVAADGERLLTHEHLPADFGALRQPDRAANDQRRRRVTPLSPADVDAALERSGGLHGPAARELGLSRHQLYRLLRRWKAPLMFENQASADGNTSHQP